MKIKVPDFTNEQLDEFTARSQGWTQLYAEEDEDYDWCLPSGIFKVRTKDYSPTSDTQAGKAQAFDLQVKYNFTVFAPKVIGQDNWAVINKDSRGEGDTLAVAICRAVITSIYGEYVEVE